MGYENGKIYKIIGGNMTYYGSTTQPLYKRFHQHKRNNNNSKSKQIIETNEALIVLVELFPCKSKEELFSRERWFIENNECINKNIPLQTKKEYFKKFYNNNKEEELLRVKKYNETHKEKRQQYKKNYEEKNREELIKKRKEYSENHIEERKKYYEEHKEQIRQKRRERYKLLGK